MRFYLGTHQPGWLAHVDVPLFVSRRRLCGYRQLPRARQPWALDSGGFTELALHGRWTVGPAEFIADVRRFAAGIGQLEWAAIQDWMCEPAVLAKTGKSVAEHQALTTESYLALRAAAPELPWAPVVQGWAVADYVEHVAAYSRAGVDLASLPVVGVGSVCRRQSGQEGAGIVRVLTELVGPRIHAFGFKQTGLVALRRARVALRSSDSMAWSFQARRKPPLLGCTEHKNCANCWRYALLWREQMLARVEAA